MIVIKIQGGLGNQMFQWACARKLAKQHCCPILLDTFPYIMDRKRKFQLLSFSNIKDQVQKEEEVLILTQPVAGLPQILDDFKTFSFPSPPLYLNGYWQSELFFEDIKEQIRSDFDLIGYKSITSRYQLSDNTISLHIRRGDYVSSGGYHPLQPISYYEKALHIFDNYDQVLVFSDDTDWCRDNLSFSKLTLVEHANEFETLYLMSNCKHNIIANSSFSWWGAWLNNNNEKKIVAPTLWFGDISGLCTDFIVPQNWIRL